MTHSYWSRSDHRLRYTCCDWLMLLCSGANEFPITRNNKPTTDLGLVRAVGKLSFLKRLTAREERVLHASSALGMY